MSLIFFIYMFMFTKYQSFEYLDFIIIKEVGTTVKLFYSGKFLGIIQDV